MSRRVVAISATDAPEGRRVGALVAERLRFRYVDEEIITTAAEKRGLDPAAIANAEKRKSLLLRVLEGLGEGHSVASIAGGPAWIPDDSSELARSHEFRQLIQDAIRETAARGDVVIVAHAASFPLAGRDDVLRVLITASMEVRVRRTAGMLDVDEERAAKEVKRSDANRADYLKRFYGVDHELPTHYDLVVNTELLTPEAAADVIAGAARS
jgi:cytidylate kinase